LYFGGGRPVHETVFKDESIVVVELEPGVQLICWALTATAAQQKDLHVFAALAEFERNLIRERTMAGLRAARARGRNGGRPRKLKTKDIQLIKALLNAGELPVRDIAHRFGVSRSTLYRNAAMPESHKALKTSWRNLKRPKNLKKQAATKPWNGHG
jgi:DNA invertase Pin-like site-specific DNA recombinase